MANDLQITARHKTWIASKQRQGYNSLKSKSGDELLIEFDKLTPAAKLEVRSRFSRPIQSRSSSQS